MFRSRRLPDGAAAGIPIVIKEGLLSKIMMGLLCSLIVTIIMNFAGLRWIAVHLFALFLSLFGSDSYIVKPKEAIKAAAKGAIDKVKGEAAKVVPVIGIVPKTPEQLKFEAEQKEAERLRREKSEIASWQARAATVKFECGKDWPLEKYRVEVALAERRAAEAEVRVAEEVKKKPLYQRADQIGLVADPALDYRTFKKQVEDAEKELANDSAYQAERRAWEEAMKVWQKEKLYGPNAKCLNRRCGYLTHENSISLSSNIACPKCGAWFPKLRAKLNFEPPPPPKEPLPPKKNPGLLWKLFR